MKKTIPINTTAEGLAFTIRARYFANSSMANITNGGGHFPSTGVIEIYEEDSSYKYNG